MRLPDLRTVLTWGAVIFAIYWVIKNPEQAAGAAHNIGRLLGNAASGISVFVSHL